MPGGRLSQAWASAPPAVVAFGGGHGLAASLSALRRITDRLTAVVTVGDDGGSSGRLRQELGALPPGDLRMALAALAGPDPWSRTWTDVFQRRFGGDGPLAGHALGNLVLTALTENVGSPVAALELAAELLGTCGRVLPLSEDGIDIVAEVVGLDPDDPAATHQVRGQVAVATTRGAVSEVWVEPAQPRVCVPACAAVEEADWLVLGPGSLYTSMLPHLLVPEMHKAITGAAAHRLLVLNLVAQPGETEGFTPEAHLRVLARHVPELTVDVVLADPAAVPDPEALAAAAADLGGRLHLAPVRSADAAGVHDAALLAAAFSAVFATSGGAPSDGAPSDGAPGGIPGPSGEAEAEAEALAARATLTTGPSRAAGGQGPAGERPSWQAPRTGGAGLGGPLGPPDPRVTARDLKE